MRTVWSIALVLLACQKEEPPPPPAAAAATPAPPPKDAPVEEKVDVIGDPVTFTALTPAAMCTYELEEVLTESLGDQLLAGHELTITYELRAKEAAEKRIAFEAEVTRVQADARRETYSAKVDSLRAGDLKRIRGGADTVVMYEMVMPFALLGKRMTIELDDRGRLLSLEGGDAVRAAMLQMHPPKPRKQPHYQKKVEVALSDEAIVEYLLPSAVVIPKEGPFAAGRQEIAEDRTFDLIEYAGVGSEGFRISVRPDRWLIEQKRGFVPVAEVSSTVPPLEKGFATTALLKGDRSLTVEFEPANPCFKRAGSAFNDLATWSGVIEDVETTTQRKRSITRIWEKK